MCYVLLDSSHKLHVVLSTATFVLYELGVNINLFPGLELAHNAGFVALCVTVFSIGSTIVLRLLICIPHATPQGDKKNVSSILYINI